MRLSGILLKTLTHQNIFKTGFFTVPYGNERADT